MSLVFCFSFKKPKAITLIVKKETVNRLQLPYTYVASRITLTVHSSLDGVGVTAASSTALANAGISCNVVAAFYHAHIFADRKEASKATRVL